MKRTINTQSQTLLTLIERQINVKGAFKVRLKEKIKGKNVLLVDDVITSGSTISECANALKASGASRVYAASAVLV